MRYRLPGAVQCFWFPRSSLPLGHKQEMTAAKCSSPKVATVVASAASLKYPYSSPCRAIWLFSRQEFNARRGGAGALWTLGRAAIALALLLSTTAGARADGNVVEGEKVFQRCASCHVVTGRDPARKGPSLQGIVGRPVASIAGFDYSPNMAALGATGAKWDEATLDQFLKYPSEFVKGTKMTAPPVRREAERADLIAFLGTIR